jgi:hypothetical protein
MAEVLGSGAAGKARSRKYIERVANIMENSQINSETPNKSRGPVFAELLIKAGSC